MSGRPSQQAIYESNTAVWLNELARAAGRRVTLAGVASPGLFLALGPWQFRLLGLQ